MYYLLHYIKNERRSYIKLFIQLQLKDKKNKPWLYAAY